MKSLRKLILTMTFLFTGMFLLNTLADNPLDAPPPPPGGGHGGGGNQTGAPIDGGPGVLLALGVIYGTHKVLKNRNAVKEEEAAEKIYR